MKQKTLGYILYEGPSKIDGKPIVAIVTGFGHKSKNPKTGDMLQTWIMRSDVEPHTAVKTGDDSSVCGECPYRPKNGGGCYVLTHFAPLTVFRTYKKGEYKKAHPLQLGIGAQRFVRVGSYGDPAAVPTTVWRSLLVGAKGWTGYTHQWRTCDPALKEICMASCDHPLDRLLAKSQGWRTFRVRQPDGGRERKEIICPASIEAGHKSTCQECQACNGLGKGRTIDVTIVAHGAVKAKALRVVG